MPHSRSPLRVVVADDHGLVRSGLIALLTDVPALTVVGECDDGEALLELVAELMPDLVITDISMPKLSGLRALEAIHARHPDIRVLVLSMYDSAEFVQQALTAGASGYLLKDSAMVELQLAIEAIRAGHTYLSPKISTRLVEQLKNAPMAAPATATSASPATISPLLTPRQVEILTLIARGKALKEIAFELGLSVKTVETHRATLMERLRIREVAGLVRYAARHGLVSLQDEDTP